MYEKVQKLSVKREPGWLYYVKGADLLRKRTGVPGAAEELVAKGKFVREEGYLYTLDAEGDIARAKLRAAESPPPGAASTATSRKAAAACALKSRKLIAKYIGKKVTAKLDGGLFDHVPATFQFRFEDPKALSKELAESYADELRGLQCLDRAGHWSSSTLMPVAAVSAAGKAGAESHAFAWVFLDWSHEAPRVVITTTDDWGGKRTAPTLAALKLRVT